MKSVLSLFILLSLSSVFSFYFIPSTKAEIIEGSLASPASNPNDIRVGFTIETVDGEGVDTSTSIALDSNDFPHVVYYKSIFVDGFSSQVLRHACYNGTSWNFETVETDVGYIVGCSIDLDSNDFPHIAYIVENDTEQIFLKYAYYNGESWVIYLVDGGGDCYRPSLSVDSSNRPHICYFESRSKTLKYAYYNGSSWHIQTIDNYGSGAWSQSIAIDSYDEPHIAYSKGPTSQIQNLTHAYFDGSSWVIETVDGENAGYFVSIAIDSRDNLHISYRNSTRGLKYAYFNGASWNLQIIPGSERDNVYDNSIALDSHDNPHISYRNLTEEYSDRSLRYAYYNDTLWNVQTVDGEGNVGHGNSIALDSKNNRHISYVYLSGFRGYDLRYALGKTQYLTDFAFKDNSGNTTLYTDPAQVQAMDPNGNPVTFTSYSDQWLDNGTWTLKQVLWQDNNVKPSIDLTYNPTPSGTWAINCRVYLISFSNSFEDSDGNDLYTLPSSFKLTFPNGTTSAPLNPNSSYYIQNGTTTWSSIIWQDTEVCPSNISFDPTDGNPTIHCGVYSLTVDPAFYDNTGTVIIQSSSWSIEFPNGTIRTVSSPVTYNQTQTGNYSIVSIIWKGTEVVPETTPTTLLTSDKLWSPSINCLLPTSLTISLSSSTSYIGFQVTINGNLACNEVGLSGTPILLSCSVTGGDSWDDISLVNTASDGEYSVVWMPSATGKYRVRATWSGNSTYPETTITVNLTVTPFKEQNVFSVTSNSTVSELAFNSTRRELSFTVSGSSGTTGYVNAYLAKTLIENVANVKVYLNSDQLNYTITSLDDSWLLHFTYLHSIHRVTIGLGAISTPFIETLLGKAVIYGIPIAAIIVLIIIYISKKKRKSP